MSIKHSRSTQNLQKHAVNNKQSLSDDEDNGQHRDLEIDALEIFIRKIERLGTPFDKKINMSDMSTKPLSITAKSIEDQSMIARIAEDDKTQDISFSTIGFIPDILNEVEEIQPKKIQPKKIQPKKIKKNPFFIGMDGGSVVGITQIGLSLKYSSVIILCINPPANIMHLNMISSAVFNKHSTMDDFDKIKDKLILVRTNIDFLKEKSHKFSCNIVKKKYLTKFNHNNILLNDEDLVSIMLNIDVTQINKYISLYVNYDIKEEMHNKIVMDFYNNNNVQVLEEISRKILFSSITKYWTLKENCNINISNFFSERYLCYSSLTKQKNKQIMVDKTTGSIHVRENKTDPLINNDKEKKTNYDTIGDVTPFFKYIDPSILPHVTFGKAYNFTKSTMTLDDVMYLYNLCTTEYDIYNVVCAVLMSHENYHLIIKNGTLLEKLKSFFIKYALVISYIQKYINIASYVEECVCRENITKDSKIVYDIDSASKLPFYPYMPTQFYRNPYFPLLVSADKVKSFTNLWGLLMIKDYKHYGIANMAEFKTHFNIFCTGRADKNIFTGCNWNNLSATGSFMTACMQKRHPVIDCYQDTTNVNDDELHKRMFDDAYKTSDIDIIVHSHNPHEFIDKVHHVYSVVKRNVKDIYKKSNVSLVSSKTLVITVHIDFFIKLGYTSKYIKDNIDTNEIREIIHLIYANMKQRNREQYEKQLGSKPNAIYEAFYISTDQSEMKLNVVSTPINNSTSKWNNDDSRSSEPEDGADSEIEELFSFRKILTKKNIEDYMNQNSVNYMNLSNLDSSVNYISISEGVKYTISSPSLLHSVELFPVNGNEAFSIVSKFHMCNVRAYYVGETKTNKENVYLLPSFVFSMMTFMNLDIKYVTGKQPSTEIVLKNLSRGYGLFLNEHEKKQLTEYYTSDGKWSKIIGKQKIFGGLTLTDHILHVNTYNKIKKNTQCQYVTKIKDIRQEWITRYGRDIANVVNYTRLKSINSDGNIIPLNRTFVQLGYKLLS